MLSRNNIDSMNFSQEHLKSLNSQLERGDKSAIARLLGISRAAVTSHLKGKYKRVSPKVIKTALDLIQERKQLESELKKALKNHYPNIN